MKMLLRALVAHGPAPSLLILSLAVLVALYAPVAKSVTTASTGFVPSPFTFFAAAAPRISLRGAAGSMMMMPDHIGDFKVGDKVKIKEGNVVFWHVKPKDYPDGFTCPKGMEGEISKIDNTCPKTGKEISANRPLVVKFEDPKFQAHFEARELEKS